MTPPIRTHADLILLIIWAGDSPVGRVGTVRVNQGPLSVAWHELGSCLCTLPCLHWVADVWGQEWVKLLQVASCVSLNPAGVKSVPSIWPSGRRVLIFATLDRVLGCRYGGMFLRIQFEGYGSPCPLWVALPTEQLLCQARRSRGRTQSTRKARNKETSKPHEVTHNNNN